jgi:hypothetical protein
METSELSSAKIILVGELMVNLPVTAIIILTAFILGQFGLGWNVSVILGVGIGWFCWGKLITKWKNWAVDQNVDRERLLRLGKLGLINFYRYKIFDEEAE